jgi:hypothetical protein
MANLSKRSTVYFDPAIHRALKLKAASSDLSVSEIVDEAIRLLMGEDWEDLVAIGQRVEEPVVSHESLLADLKKHGQI